MTQNDIEEALSRAYIYAIAGRAGVNIAEGRKDYGVDGTFKKVANFAGGRFIETGVGIDFQLKASINCKKNAGHIAYRMEAEAYNKLVSRRANGTIPIVLIVLVLPLDADTWIAHSEDELLLRHCCYWYDVGEIPTPNTNSITLHIPRSQQLTPAVLEALLNQAQAGTLQ